MRSKILQYLKLFKPGHLMLVLLGAGLILRVLLSFIGTLELDFNTFVAWSGDLAKHGLKGFYQRGWSDYLPGYLYVLFFLGKLGIGAVPLVYKLPAIFSDLITGLLVFEIVKKMKNEKLALMSSALYIFNPAVISNSTLWGQVDSLTALTALLSVYLIEHLWFLSALAFSAGVLIKPQALFIFPVLLFVSWKKKWNAGKLVLYGLVSATVFLLGFVPFWQEGNFVSFIASRIAQVTTQYPFTSVNAFNFWGIFGTWRKDTLFTQTAGYLLSFLPIFYFIYALAKKRLKGGRYYLLAIVFLSTFLFLTRLHERHLLPLFAPLSIAAALNPALWVAYLLYSLTYVANLVYSHIWISQSFKAIFSSQAISVISVVNTAFLFFVLFAGKIKFKFKFAREEGSLDFKKMRVKKKTLRILLFGVLVFSLVARILFLGNPKHEYFDEVYHAFTARQILHGDPKAWEWWNTPPEGFAYEWTHPPLAKLGMVVGMVVFGENSFGWRVPGALLGTGSILLVYLIAKEIFKDALAGLLSSLVFSLDGLPLVASRIGMNDSYFLFFALMSLFLFLKDKNLFSSLSLGLAAASKWSTLWLIPVLVTSHFVFKKKLRFSYVFFFLIPPLVYLASYLPMFLTGHGIDIFWGMQKQMWWYHTGLDATHPYESQWWSWPLMLRSVYLFVEDGKDFVGKIYMQGNPAVFWGGLAAVVYSLWESLKTRNKKLAFVIFSYLAFFVSWAGSPRIMFLYHYLPSLPFLAIIVGYMLRKHPRMVPLVVPLALLLFVYFFPHWTGIAVPKQLDESYYWFSSWR